MSSIVADQKRLLIVLQEVTKTIINGAVSNKLTNGGRGVQCVGGGRGEGRVCESVDVRQSGCFELCKRHSLYNVYT
jgi:hypothetical protein